MFILKGNAVNDPDLKANINGNTLFEIESVTSLGSTFSNYAKLTAHAEDIFRKGVHPSVFVKKL